MKRRTVHPPLAEPWLHREIFERFDATEAYRRYMDFLLEAVALIEEDCPPVARHAVAVARAYWRGEGAATAQSLTAARLDCLRHLQSKRELDRPRDKTLRRVRAVCFLLYAEPDPDHDIAESAGWFIQFMRDCGCSENRLGLLFEDAFSR